DTLKQVLEETPEIPVVVLTGLGDEKTAVEAVQRGAQDYLEKSLISPAILTRSIRYAIERQKLRKTIQELTLMDELTGIYNRKGFMSLGGHHISVADRSGRGLILFYCDIDGLKKINDTLGHEAGDQVLQETGRILRETFRESDLIARLGGDEFAVLVSNVDRTNDAILRKRLWENMERYNNSKKGRQYDLSLSAGAVYYDPSSPCPLAELMSRADKEMYREKREKKGFTP
ncbi:MAG: diguanylate cyclase, partial [Nitrospirales bacterium]|nr:diguanylate cyclase [Nitrospirales bacterium]